MNNEELNALKNVVDYLRDDEEEHFEESGKPDNHIYHDILILDKFLNKINE